MSDRDRKSTADPQLSSSVLAVLASTLVVPLGVLQAVTADGAGPAAATAGFVLASAIALHLGYGVLTRVATPAIHELLSSD